MSGRPVLALLVLGGLALGGAFAACGTTPFTTPVDAGADVCPEASDDGGLDASSEVGPTCSSGQVACRGQCLNGSDCSECPDPLLCLEDYPHCVAKCVEGCHELTRPCYECPDGGSSFTATCTALDTSGALNCLFGLNQHC